MADPVRVYSDEFKEQAIQLAKEMGSNCKAARELGINEVNIRSWIKKKKENLAFKEQLPEDPSASVSELQRLRKENAELKKVNQILKAAAAVFCQDQLK